MKLRKNRGVGSLAIRSQDFFPDSIRAKIPGSGIRKGANQGIEQK
jgi:hypothetical protein